MSFERAAALAATASRADSSPISLLLAEFHARGKAARSASARSARAATARPAARRRLKAISAARNSFRAGALGLLQPAPGEGRYGEGRLGRKTAALPQPVVVDPLVSPFVPHVLQRLVDPAAELRIVLTHRDAVGLPPEP